MMKPFGKTAYYSLTRTSDMILLHILEGMVFVSFYQIGYKPSLFRRKLTVIFISLPRIERFPARAWFVVALTTIICTRIP